MVAAAVVLLAAGNAAFAAKCGSNAAGFDRWKAEFSQEAAARGIHPVALNALAGTRYSTKTIYADRNQKSFKLSLDQFMAKRGGRTIASRGKGLKQQTPPCFAHRAALRRSRRAADRDLGHGDRLRRLHGQPEHPFGGRDPGL